MTPAQIAEAQRTAREWKIRIYSRDSHSAVGCGERLIEGQAGVHSEGSRTPFDEAQADPEEVRADDEIVIVGDDAHRDYSLDMREKLEDVGVDGEAGKVAYAPARRSGSTPSRSPPRGGCPIPHEPR